LWSFTSPMEKQNMITNYNEQIESLSSPEDSIEKISLIGEKNGLISSLVVDYSEFKIDSTNDTIIKLNHFNNQDSLISFLTNENSYWANYYLAGIYLYKKNYDSARIIINNIQNLFPYDSEAIDVCQWTNLCIAGDSNNWDSSWMESVKENVHNICYHHTLMSYKAQNLYREILNFEANIDTTITYIDPFPIVIQMPDSLPKETLTVQNIEVCKDTQIVLNQASPKGGLYIYNNGIYSEDSVFSETTPGEYLVYYWHPGRIDTTNSNIDSFTITIHPELEITPSVKNVSCAEVYDGEIMLNLNGGKSPYSFNWSNDSTSQHITGLHPAVYYVTVTDSIGCMKKDTIEVLPSLDLQVDIDFNDETSILKAIVNQEYDEDYVYHYIRSSNDTPNSISVDPYIGGNFTVTVSKRINANCYTQDDIYVSPRNDRKIAISGENMPLKLFPNPTKGNIYLNLQGNSYCSETYSYLLTNKLGQHVLNNNIHINPEDKGNIAFDLSKIAPDIYFFILFKNGNEIFKHKVIKL
jgi:hypothetical protein